MRFWGWLAFVVPLMIYAASASPNVNVWDTAELQTVPYIFGIAHPTGFPVYILLGWVFSHAFAVGSVAWRMTLLSALCTAGSAAVLFALCRRLGIAAPASFGAALLFALGDVAWTRGTRAEVHTLATLEALVAATAAVLWYQEKDARWLIVTAVALGLGFATHGMIVLMLPGVLFLVFAAHREPSARTLVLCCVGLVAPLLTYAYIPLRAAYVEQHRIDPTLTLGIPPGRPYWDYGNPVTPAAFLTYVSGSQFRAPAAVASLLDPLTYATVAPRVWQVGVEEFGLVALAFALLGATVLVRRDALLAAGLGMALLPGVPFAYAYAAESDPARYALPAFALVAALIACGVGVVAALLAGSDVRTRDATIFAAMLVFASVQLWANKDTFAQRFDTRWSDYVDRVRHATPNDAVIVVDWAYATPLAYAAFVERSMGGRIVETAHPSDDAKWLTVWAKKRPVYVVSASEPIIAGVKLAMVDRGAPNVLRVTGSRH